MPTKDTRGWPLADRFWMKVDRSGGPDACWLWRGAHGKNGYGNFGILVDGVWKTFRSNRVAWMITNGPIPDGLHVCHRCDVPGCCNPGHMWLGTNAENTADKIHKGRLIVGNHVGERNGRATITEDLVREIRGRFVRRRGATAALAREYNLTWEIVAAIVNGKTWRHVR